MEASEEKSETMQKVFSSRMEQVRDDIKSFEPGDVLRGYTREKVAELETFTKKQDKIFF